MGRRLCDAYVLSKLSEIQKTQKSALFRLLMYASSTIHHHLCVAAVYIEQWDDVYVMRTFLSKASEIHNRTNLRFSDYKCMHQAQFTTIFV